MSWNTKLLPGALWASALLVCASVLTAEPAADSAITIRPLALDLDARPDLDGLQYSAAAVKDFPSSIIPITGLPAEKLEGYLISARLVGPGLGSRSLTLLTAPGGRFEIPPLGQEGTYYLEDVHLLDPSGQRVAQRDPSLPRVEIQVIDELLVTEILVEQLSLEEIRERGIVVDSDNFTVFDFAIGLTIDGEQVSFELPVVAPVPGRIDAGTVPTPPSLPPPSPFMAPQLEIPNFSVQGFFLELPPEEEDEPLPQFPGVPGVIIIPGEVGFLNQFFSAILVVTNAAPGGSGLSVHELEAEIRLPTGPDGIPDTGDDVLRVAETASHGVVTKLPIRRLRIGSDGEESLTDDPFLLPQERGKGEFLLEGLREGTHLFRVDLTGDLVVPGLGTYALTGQAAGAVVVRNPTFNLVLAHPNRVREGERYSLYVTVSNTSASDANLFRIGLSERSLSGTVLVPGTPNLHTLDTLVAGQSEIFEFELESRQTGQVGGTVFQADDGLTGSFLLSVGVSENGIPLSPDTLVLPEIAQSLPDPPPLERDFLRILGQAWSAATAPRGSLPPELLRPSEDGVRARAIEFSRLGLRVALGEDVTPVVSGWTHDWLETEIGRFEDDLVLDTGDEEADAEARELRDVLEHDFRAFDLVRRSARQGRFVARDIGYLLRQAQVAGDYPDLVHIRDLFADVSSGRAPFLLAGIGQGADGVPARLRIVDSEGQRLGAIGPPDPVDADGDDGRAREIPAGEIIPLIDEPGSHQELALIGAVSDAPYTVEIRGEGDGSTELVLLCQGASGLRSVSFSGIPLRDGSVARIVVEKGNAGAPMLAVDIDGDGHTDTVIEPLSDVALPDLVPEVVLARQWGKGTPTGEIDLENGDPFGRLVIVSFSERVESASAEDESNYALDDNTVRQAVLQPGRRLVFLLLEEGMDPADPRETLTVSGVRDLAGNVMQPQAIEIVPDPELIFGGRVSGVVRRADGIPVPGAQVIFRQLQPDLSQPGEPVVYFDLLQRITDEEGRYEVDFVLSNPHGPAQLVALDPETGARGEILVKPFTPGQELRGDIILRGFGSIRGLVLDENGIPLGSEFDADGRRTRSVVAEVACRTGTLGGVHVEADGSFFLAPVPVGAGIVRVTDGGTGDVGVVATSVAFAGALTEVEVVLYSRRGDVAGRVLRADGEPAAGIPVIIRGEVPTGFDGGLTTTISDVAFIDTDSNGAFEFLDVPVGQFEVRTFDPTTYEEASAAGAVADGGRSEVTILLPGAGGILRGRVIDADRNDVAGARVAGGPHQGTTDATGRFEFVGFPIGIYDVGAQSPDTPAFGRLQVEFTSGDEIQEVVIRLRPLGNVAGTVFAADGTTPIVGGQVNLWLDGGILARTLTNAQGQYAFVNVPAYSLREPDNPAEYRVQSILADASDGGEALTTLRFVGETVHRDVVYRGRGPVRWRLVQDDGTPVVGNVRLTYPVIRVLTGADGIAGEIRSARNDAARSFIEEAGGILSEFGESLPPEAAEFLASTDPDNEAGFPIFTTETVVLQGVGLNDGVVDGVHETEPHLAGGVRLEAEVTGFTARSIRNGEIPRTSVDANRFLDFEDVVLSVTTGLVRGRVFLPDGVTPAGANVKVSFAGGVNFEAFDVLTDAEGRYEFPLAPVGAFRVTANAIPPQERVLAQTGDEILTNDFATFNVELFGQSSGDLPPDGDIEVDIRLQGAGGVLVRVEEEDGTPLTGVQVSLSTSASFDGRVEDTLQGQVNTESELDLVPVTEGPFQVTAALNTRFGFAAGEIPRQPIDGLTRVVVVTMGRSTTADGTSTPVTEFGTVRGVVLDPLGEPFDGVAQVTYSTRGITLDTTTLADGSYLFENVPTGVVQLSALDRNTNRRGRGSGVLAGDGDVLVVDLTLDAVGTVEGAVYEFDGAQTVSGAVVQLVPEAQSGVGPITTETGLEGRYAFTGVPEGDFSVTATDTTRDINGTETGSILPGFEQVEIDIYLGPSGRVEGVVYAAGTLLDANGQPVDETGAPDPGAVVIPFAQVSLETPGAGADRITTADGDGAFAFDNVVPGSYSVSSSDQTRPDGARREILLADNAEIVDASLVFRGLGIVSGFVRDAVSGDGVEAVRVTLQSSSPFSLGAITRFSDANGAFVFDEVPIGAFTLSATTTLENPELGASAVGELASFGVEIIFEDGDADPDHDALRLDEVGVVFGRVLREGEPAVGVAVTLEGASGQLAQLTDADGLFRFEGLPLGSYDLEAVELFSGARVRASAELATNGEELDLGDLELDGDPPVVIATVPIASGSGAPIDTNVEVLFNEPIDAETIDEVTFRVEIDGQPVEGTRSLSPDGATITFTPASAFPDLEIVRVVLAADIIGFQGVVTQVGVRDRSGNSIEGDFVFTFSTRDATPPTIVSLAPAADEPQVALDSIVRVSFSEPMDASSVADLRIVTAGGQPVPGVSQAVAPLGDTVFVFVPDVFLEPDAEYFVLIDGPVLDRAGNALASGGLSYSFFTLDTLGPEIVGVSTTPESVLIAGQTVVFEVDLPDPDDVAAVDFLIDGVLVATIDAPPFRFEHVFEDVAPGGVLVEAIARDASGNRSDSVTTSVVIGSDLPPTLSLTPPVSLEVGPGQLVGVVADAQDDIGVVSIAFQVPEIVGASSVRNFDPAMPNAAAGFNFTVPTTAADGSTLTVRAVASDASGQTSQASLILTVRDTVGPTVVLLEPVAGTKAGPNEAVPVRIQASDASGVAQLSFEVLRQGVAIVPEAPVTVPGSPTLAVQTFSFLTPDPNDTSLIVRAYAEDAIGNRSFSSSRIVLPRDVTPPVVDLSLPDGDRVAAGDSALARAQVTDDVSIDELRFFVDGALQETRSAAGASSVSEDFVFAVPAATAIGTTFQLGTQAVDVEGNASAIVEVVVRVADLEPPVVTISQPANGTGVAPGETVMLNITASDNVAVESISFVTMGADGAFGGEIIDPPTSPAAASFQFDIPAAATEGSSIEVRALAFDAEGNSGESAVVTLNVLDGVPPTVVSVLPADGASNVDVTADIVVTFDEAIDPSTVTAASFVLTDSSDSSEVAGTFAFSNADRTLTFSPASDLTANTLHALRLTTAIEDVAGNGLAADFQSDFTTMPVDSDAPIVLSVIPEDGAVDVPVDLVELTLHFSEALDPATVTDSTITLEPVGGVPLPIAVVLLPPDDLVLVQPDPGSLVGGILYRLTLSSGIRDMAGNALVPFESEFTTVQPDTVGPRLMQLTPLDASTNVSVLVRPRAVFDEALDRTSVDASSFRLLDALDQVVPATFQFSNGDRAVSIIPDSALDLLSTYRVELTDSVTDLAGNAITQADGTALVLVTNTFATGSIVLSQPVDGQRVIEGQSLTVQVDAAQGDLTGLTAYTNGESAGAINSPAVAQLSLDVTVPLLSDLDGDEFVDWGVGAVVFALPPSLAGALGPPDGAAFHMTLGETYSYHFRDNQLLVGPGDDLLLHHTTILGIDPAADFTLEVSEDGVNFAPLTPTVLDTQRIGYDVDPAGASIVSAVRIHVSDLAVTPLALDALEALHSMPRAEFLSIGAEARTGSTPNFLEDAVLEVLPADGDEDADGIDNGTEVDIDSDPFVFDSDQDPDGDQLSNLDEVGLGTDPNNDDSDGDGLTDGDEHLLHLTSPLNADTDGDGMDDGAEIAVGLDPFVDDADEDPDGDGITNLMEIQFGSDPFTANDGLVVATGETLVLSGHNVYTSVLVATGGTIRGEGSEPLVIVSAGDFIVNGAIDVSGGDGVDADGTAGGAGGLGVASGADGGGGSAVNSQPGAAGEGPGGGGGGNGTTGTNSTAGTGGGGRYAGVYGTAELEPYEGGSGGGGGGAGVADTSNGGGGGAGGGAVRVSAVGTLTIVGEVLARGGAGGNPAWLGGQGGGGSGGAIWLVAETLNLSGVVDASGEQGGRAGRVRVDASTLLRDGTPVDAYDFVDRTLPLVGYFGLDDEDQDGLTTEEERELGTNRYLADTDGDGATDADEVAAGLDPLVADAQDDPDGDGLTSAEEAALGSDPFVFDSDQDPDADGLTNAEEVALGTDAQVADTDGDGLSDGDEVVAGSDALVADSDADGLADGVDALPLDPSNNPVSEHLVLDTTGATESVVLSGRQIFADIVIAAGTTVRGEGDRPLELISLGDALIEGVVDVSGGDGRDAIGLLASGARGGHGVAGGRVGGAGAFLRSAPGTVGGGPGGGVGGQGTTSTNSTGGMGGGGHYAGVYGTAELEPFEGGSGGGGGGAGAADAVTGVSAGRNGGGGGAGGGAVRVSAAGTLTIVGEVLARGGAGGNPAWLGGQGGGGSGGAIWLVAETLNLSGVVDASGEQGGRAGRVRVDASTLLRDGTPVDAYDFVDRTLPLVGYFGLDDEDQDGLTTEEERELGTNRYLADTDGDGATDADEVAAGLDPLVADAQDDPDGDGLTSAEEAALGSDPFVFDSDQDPDADGLTNAEEVALGTDAQVADTDGDGLSDGDEVVAGSDALVADSDADGLADGVDALPLDPSNNPVSEHLVLDTTGATESVVLSGRQIFADIVIAAGTTVRGEGDRPLELISLGDALIEGVVDVSGGDGRDAIGLLASGARGGHGVAGGRVGGAGAFLRSAPGTVGGGPGSGVGGQGTTSTNSTGGMGGGGHYAGVYGTAELEPFEGGSGGGGGGAGAADAVTGVSAGRNGGGGGAGGGAVRVSAAGTLTIVGEVLARGGAGGNPAWLGGQGGGGSGGAIWLVAETLNLSGVVDASGEQGGRAGRVRVDASTLLRDGTPVDAYDFVDRTLPLVGYFGLDDEDQDGLTTEEERELGTNRYLADTDGDGATDADEVAAGLDPLVADAQDDPDGDGLTSAEEAALGSDPFVFDSDQDPDADGLTNAEEVALGTDAQVADTDGDGLSDGDEVVAGSDALVADSDADGLADGVDALPLDPSNNPVSEHLVLDTTGATESVVLSGRQIFADIVIAAGTTVRGEGDRPLELISLGDALIEGVVDVSGGDGRDAIGLLASGARGGHGVAGGRVGGAGAFLRSAPGTVGGGPGGGVGGQGTTSTNSTGGMGGGGHYAGVYGTAELEPFEGGSGGGGGGAGAADAVTGVSAGRNGGGGGAGGGAVRVSAAGTLTIVGEVLARGGAGGNPAWLGGQGGGGSGGAIWLVAETLNLSGVVDASGEQGGRAGRVRVDASTLLRDGTPVDAYDFVDRTLPLVGYFGLDDEDQDGLTTEEERELGTNRYLADTDGDGATDADEVAAGLDPLVADAQDDPDGDGLTSAEEAALGSDPFVFDSDQDPDADGLTNAEEVALGTDAQVADTDGDGLSDGDEVVAGSDALVADSDADGLADGVDALPLDPSNNPVSEHLVLDTTGATESVVLSGRQIFADIVIAAGTTVRGEGDRPLELISLGDALIEGVVDVSGGDGRDAIGLLASGARGGHGVAGGRVGGAGAFLRSAPGTVGGGPGGGVGGQGTTSTNSTGGMGGGGHYAGVYGTAELEPFEGGSGGGGGGAGAADAVTGVSAGRNGGGGGAGGGAVRVSAAGTLTIVGEVLARGGAGGNPAWLGGQGGGGSGGAIWLVAETLNLSGGNVNALGDSNGGAGRIRVDATMLLSDGSPVDQTIFESLTFPAVGHFGP